MVSVIIPTHNSGQYIGSALDTVLGQTVKDVEIIVVDDGSTDETRNIIAKCYPMVRYIFQVNNGAASARNRGIREATGEFVAFLDADDLWLPMKLEKQEEYLRLHPNVGIVITEERAFNSSGPIPKRSRKRETLMNGDTVRRIFMYSGVATPTVMVRRKVFEDVGLFDERLKVAEDDNLWMRIAMKWPMGLVDEVFVLCRIREGSLTRTPGSVFAGVMKHLDIIEAEYPDLRLRLQGLINKKRSSMYFSEGIQSLSCNELRVARAHFKESWRLHKLNVRSALYALACILPVWAIKWIRVSRRTILNR